MKLLLVTPYFYPKVGGLENYAFKFSLELKRKFKVQLVVVTSNHKNKKDVKETVKGIKVYRLAPLFKVSNTPINPFWIWKIKRIIEKEKPDIINAHTPVPGIADMAALVANKTPFILTYHALSLYKYNFTFINIIVNVYKYFEWLTFSRANKIIVVSDEIKEHVSKEFSSKTVVIYNALSQNELNNVNRYKRIKSLQVIFIGNLDKSHEWKGLTEILEAIKILNNKGLQIYLSIIGDGSNRSNYEKIVNEKQIEKFVTFHGKLVGENKSNVLRSSNLAIIYPKSSNDAFPTVALEYWSYKLPIISANILPLNKLFKHRNTAYLVTPKNSHLLAKAILRILLDHELAQTIGNGGYKELKQKYILENEVKKLYCLLKEELK